MFSPSSIVRLTTITCLLTLTAVSAFAVGTAPAYAYNYDDLVCLVNAEQRALGKTDSSGSLDQRLQAVEVAVLGRVGSGSEKKRLGAVCARLGITGGIQDQADPAEKAIHKKASDKDHATDFLGAAIVPPPPPAQNSLSGVAERPVALSAVPVVMPVKTAKPRIEKPLHPNSTRADEKAQDRSSAKQQVACSFEDDHRSISNAVPIAAYTKASGTTRGSTGVGETRPTAGTGSTDMPLTSRSVADASAAESVANPIKASGDAFEQSSGSLDRGEDQSFHQPVSTTAIDPAAPVTAPELPLETRNQALPSPMTGQPQGGQGGTIVTAVFMYVVGALLAVALVAWRSFGKRSVHVDRLRRTAVRPKPEAVVEWNLDGSKQNHKKVASVSSEAKQVKSREPVAAMSSATRGRSQSVPGPVARMMEKSSSLQSERISPDAITKSDVSPPRSESVVGGSIASGEQATAVLARLAHYIPPDAKQAKVESDHSLRRDASEGSPPNARSTAGEGGVHPREVLMDSRWSPARPASQERVASNAVSTTLVPELVLHTFHSREGQRTEAPRAEAPRTEGQRTEGQRTEPPRTDAPQAMQEQLMSRLGQTESLSAHRMETPRSAHSSHMEAPHSAHTATSNAHTETSNAVRMAMPLSGQRIVTPRAEQIETASAGSMETRGAQIVEVIPAERMVPNTEWTVASAERTVASAERTEVSAKRTKASAERTEVSAERTKASAERTVPSAELTVASAERTEANADRTVASAERAVASAERTEANAERPVASAERTEANADRTVASAERAVASAERTEANAERPVASAERTEANADRTVASAERTAVSAERTVASRERTEAIAERTVVSPERTGTSAARTEAGAMEGIAPQSSEQYDDSVLMSALRKLQRNAPGQQLLKPESSQRTRELSVAPDMVSKVEDSVQGLEGSIKVAKVSTSQSLLSDNYSNRSVTTTEITGEGPNIPPAQPSVSSSKMESVATANSGGIDGSINAGINSFHLNHQTGETTKLKSLEPDLELPAIHTRQKLTDRLDEILSPHSESSRWLTRRGYLEPFKAGATTLQYFFRGDGNSLRLDAIVTAPNGSKRILIIRENGNGSQRISSPEGEELVCLLSNGQVIEGR